MYSLDYFCVSVSSTLPSWKERQDLLSLCMMECMRHILDVLGSVRSRECAGKGDYLLDQDVKVESLFQRQKLDPANFGQCHGK